MEIAVPSLRAVGYVRGAADGVPEALAGLGIPVVEITPDSLARGDLSRFDAVVIGSRAYETVPAVQEFNSRLLAYARAGGLPCSTSSTSSSAQLCPVPDDPRRPVAGSFLSGKATMPKPGERPDSHDRVTDQDAAGAIVIPRVPVVRAPNAIGPDDWKGWVQSAGSTCRSWAPEYRPVLEMHDRGAGAEGTAGGPGRPGPMCTPASPFSGNSPRGYRAPTASS
jgi:hypothetical protein